MTIPESAILLLRSRIEPAELSRLVRAHFDDMVKYVVDIERGVVAIGGEMHADAEAILLADGSRQTDLWGANYYPGRGTDGCVEYTSLINIRPSDDNRSMEIEDAGIRERVRDLTLRFIGCGDERDPS